jgi:subtilisin family serine protease
MGYAVMTRRPIAYLVAALVVVIAQPAFAAPGPPDAPEWWFDSWHVPALWSGGARGQGVTIAEIDTGVNAALPELAGQIVSGKDFGVAGGDGRTDHAINMFGHGTAMASIMVARPGLLGITGLAPSAKVLPVAIPLSGTNDAPADGGDHLADAIRWSVDHGARILSMSLGGSRNPAQNSVPCPPDEQEAINYAIGKGAIVVAAAGNDGRKGSPVEEPGVCLGVVSVGAVDSKGRVAGFSSRHRYLTVSAPGVNVPSLSRVAGQAFAGDGTSQATAITSAALALIWSRYPTLNGRQVVTRLLATLDRHSQTRDPAYGYGIVNPARAINGLVPSNAPNPVYAALDPFIAASAYHAKPLPLPAPVALSKSPPGAFSVGKTESLWSSRVWVGLAVGLIGAVALTVLSFVGIRRSRRFAAMPPDAWRPRPAALRDGARVGASTYRDESGLIWHDLSPPREGGT